MVKNEERAHVGENTVKGKRGEEKTGAVARSTLNDARSCSTFESTHLVLTLLIAQVTTLALARATRLEQLLEAASLWGRKLLQHGPVIMAVRMEDGG
jgi:hypothetical protein